MSCEIALQQEAKHFMSGMNEIILESQAESDGDWAHVHSKKKKKKIVFLLLFFSASYVFCKKAGYTAKSCRTLWSSSSIKNTMLRTCMYHGHL